MSRVGGRLLKRIMSAQALSRGMIIESILGWSLSLKHNQLYFKIGTAVSYPENRVSQKKYQKPMDCTHKRSYK